jgi:hypothetical protein
VLIDRFPQRIDNAADFAHEHRVVLIRAGNVPIDVSLGALPFEHRAAARATPSR